MLDRFLGGLSGRLPAVSVALVLVVVAGVFVSIFVLPGDEPPTPLPQQPSAPQLTSPTPAPLAAPTGTAIPLAAGTTKVLFEPGSSATLTSPDGVVTITVDSGAIDGSVNLTYIPLEASQIPVPPQGYSVANVAFDLIPTTLLDVEIADFVFVTPREVAIRLSGSVLDVAESRPDLISVQHYKDSTGWSELPTRLDLGSDTIFAQVSSLSVFAQLVEDDDAVPQPMVTGEIGRINRVRWRSSGCRFCLHGRTVADDDDMVKRVPSSLSVEETICHKWSERGWHRLAAFVQRFRPLT